MKRFEEIEKIKNMNDKELFRLVRENKKIRNDKNHYKENFEKYYKLYQDLVWNKENNPDEFALEQRRAVFNKLSSWTERIIFVIKTENRFLTSVEIFEIAHKYNAPLVMLWNFPIATLRQNIHLAVGYGLVKSERFRGRRSHYFGLPIFYDSSGNMKQEYKNMLDNI